MRHYLGDTNLQASVYSWKWSISPSFCVMMSFLSKNVNNPHEYRTDSFTARSLIKKKNYQKLFFLRLCVLEESNGEIVNCENNTTADNNNSDEANNPDVNNVNKLRLVYYKFIRINKYLKKA